MRPIDPAGGIVQEFAAELRQLREQAGNPPFRELARRAHYSASTLSVACSGAALPSREVTLALVRACGGSADYWLRRWHAASAVTKAAAGQGPQPELALPGNGLAATGDPGGRGPGRRGVFQGGRDFVGRVRRDALRHRRWRNGLAITALIMATAVASTAVWSAAHSASAPSLPQNTADAAAQAPYIGVSPCDIGAVILSQAPVRLPSRLELGGQNYPAGTVVGEVALRFSPRCALAWTRFLPDSSFGTDALGSVTLRSYRATDGAASTLTVSPIVAVEGDPVLTVPGCVLAQVTIRFGSRQPTATARTGCYP